MSNVIEKPGKSLVVQSTCGRSAGTQHVTGGTLASSFDGMKHLLSHKPLRGQPLPRLFDDVEAVTPANKDLRRLAQESPPATSWLDGEEECPF